MVEEAPTSFSPFSLVNCTLLSHFSFNDFVAVAFLDLARDLDTQIQISNMTSFPGRQYQFPMLPFIAWLFSLPFTFSRLSTFLVYLPIVLLLWKVLAGLVYKTAHVFSSPQLVLCLTCTVIQSLIPKDYWLDLSLTDLSSSPTQVQETRNSMCHCTTLECALLEI